MIDEVILSALALSVVFCFSMAGYHMLTDKPAPPHTTSYTIKPGGMAVVSTGRFRTTIQCTP